MEGNTRISSMFGENINNHKVNPDNAIMKKLRVFISSPGDVQQERLIAKKVIANLNRIYSQYVELETVMWEDLRDGQELLDSIHCHPLQLLPKIHH